jgi:putative DNA primase/helicase
MEAVESMMAYLPQPPAPPADGGGNDGGGGGGGGAAARREPNRGRFLTQNPNAPMPVAVDLLGRWDDVRTVAGNPVTRTVFWRGDWWDHVGSHYQLASDRAVELSLWRVLNRADYEHFTENAEGDREVQIRRWEPNKAKVANVQKALEACCEVDDEAEAGSWLVFPEDAEVPPFTDETRQDRLVSFTNALLDPVTQQVYDHTDAYLNTYALPFEYDVTAECPTWTAYLESILAADSIALLQEWFGYVVSGRTDLQKMLFMIGPSRSGKGTIAYILSSLIGLVNVAGPTMNNFAGQFGLQPLMGKPLAIFDDVRLPPRPDNVYTALERLLSVIGEAPLTVDRKNKEPLTVKLPTRIIMSANELLEFPDAVGAMQTRMLVLVFTKSFVGREKRDDEFKDLFLAELPGILNWALAGLRRLDEARGQFTPPADSTEVSEELRDSANPVRAFVREHLVEHEGNPDHWVFVDDVYKIYAAAHGGFKDDTRAKMRLGQQLKATCPWVVKKRRTLGDETGYAYLGLAFNEDTKARVETEKMQAMWAMSQANSH